MHTMHTNAALYEQQLGYADSGVPYQCLAQPWFVRTVEPTLYPRHGCVIEPLNCGARVFAAIARDIQAARHGVDIITWGFDPGMVLVRDGGDNKRYGELLIEIATRAKNPVEVRLLVYHDDQFAQWQVNNIPTYYGDFLAFIGACKTGYYSEAHQDYNAKWLKRVCANEFPNICFHVRSIDKASRENALKNETVKFSRAAVIAKRYATHHQKMVLIDYEAPARAVGYVMGHNSITDFWDTEQHLFRDPRRERFFKEKHAALQKKAWKEGESYDSVGPGYQLTEWQQQRKEQLVQAYIDRHSFVTKPYQDVSCRLQGPILYDLNFNFCQGWQESHPPTSLFTDMFSFIDTSSLKRLMPTALVNSAFELALVRKAAPDFIARRKKLPLSAFDLGYGKHSVQLLRTQPMHGEKSIKECYANFCRQMQHYMLIQNQYIQYEAWAQYLIECVARLRSEGYRKSVYVFILTSTPESTGMDRPTYDVVGKVGASATMRVEHEEAVQKAIEGKAKAPVSVEEMAENGINVFMGSMWTCATELEKLQPEDYEEIYIHAKVAVVDDAAFTIGSANLNLRSMALDSELNVLSHAKDVAYQLRTELFRQCTGHSGPPQFADMEEVFNDWIEVSSTNFNFKNSGKQLLSQLLRFYVDRQPGDPVI